MSLSLIRGLTASVISNVSSLKRQSKRLHKYSNEVFGQSFTLEQCQEAIAKANGFYKWSDVTDLAGKFSSDKSSPFWTIKTRNDVHESVLAALVRVNMDINAEHPVVITGDKESALIGTCLWLEAISLRKLPGLILVETDNLTVEDTEIGKAFMSLGKDEEFSRFRVIDARQKNLAVSISTTVRDWVWAVGYVLSKEDFDSFENSGGNHLLKSVASAYEVSDYSGNAGYEEEVSFRVIEKAAHLLTNPDIYINALLRDMETNRAYGLRLDIKNYQEKMSKDVLDKVSNIINLTAECNARLGPVIWDESKYTPTVVLFSKKSIESEVIAAAVHSMYYTRYVSQRDIRPILYFSDSGSTSIPQMLTFGSNSIIVNNSISTDSDVMKSFIMERALFASTNDGFLSFSGRKWSFKPQ